MAIAQMKKFQILGRKRNLEAISHHVIGSRKVHPVQYDSFLSEKLGDSLSYLRDYQQESNYQGLLDRVEDLLLDLNMEVDLEKLPELEDLQGIDFACIREDVNNITQKVDRIIRFKERLEEAEEKSKDIQYHIWLMRNLDLDIKELKKLQHISLIFGRVNKGNYERLIRHITDWPILILDVYEENDCVWFFSFTKKEHEERALNFLNSVYFKRLVLPDRAKGRPDEILSRLEHRLERIEIGYEEIELELKKYRHLYGGKLALYYQRLKALDKLNGIINSYYGQSDHLFLLSGWIPAEEEDEFKDKLANGFDDVVYLSNESDMDEDAPPTKLTNQAWLKPFEPLVILYGTPGYKEVDPTILIGLTYMLMFGMMFGDVGQGLVFAAVGYLLLRRHLRLASREIGLFLVYLGTSSTIFGFLYGSIFGMEDLLPALWFRPMHNITRILSYSIGLGVAIILIGIGTNMVNSFRNGDMEEGLFSSNGLVGMAFYLLFLYTIYHFATTGKFIFNLPVTVALLLLPMVLILFKRPLASLIQKRGFWPAEGGSYFMEVSFELLDTVISFLSNTVSFVRIGAFTLNHVGLFMAVFILAEMLRGAGGGWLWSTLLIIGGNILIMVLEGLVVGIQVLRLEYYEFFGKFYRGDGTEYRPLEPK